MSPPARVIFQPMLAVWAETGVVLADEFRDGNVPAQMEPLNAAQRAFAAVPPTVERYYFRGDSACHEGRLVNWLRNEEREDGPKGSIGFAISARMSAGLHAALLAVAALVLLVAILAPVAREHGRELVKA